MFLRRYNLPPHCFLPVNLAAHFGLLLFAPIVFSNVTRIDKDHVIFEIVVENHQDADGEKILPVWE